MTLRNRVDPYGELHAVDTRGKWTGNRGVLHDADRRIVARWRNKRWICCALRFKDWHRVPMTPGRWTELFFLDEATAYAAGHRPCAECRRAAYDTFRAAWSAANPKLAGSPKPSAEKIDAALHEERLAPRRPRAALDDLPDGTMVELDGAPHLVLAGALRAWGFAGYAAPRTVDPATRVAMITPRSIVRAFAHGLAPQITIDAFAPREASHVVRDFEGPAAGQ